MASRNVKKPGFFGLRVVRNRVFGENTASQPAATAKTRFLGFTGGQKPGFWREYLVTARSNGKNPVSLVWFLWF